MIKDIFEAIRSAAQKLFSNWGALLISLTFYAMLIAVLYFFFTIREASRFQVVLSVLVLPLIGIFSFFLIQAMGLSYVRIGVGPLYLFKRALKDCWKLLVVSIPLILLAWLISYGAGKAENYLFSQIYDGSVRPGQWKLMLIGWLRLFLLYFVIPLSAIHLWISAVREGVIGAFKGVVRNLAGAFAPRSVLIYILLAAVFGLIAYFLFFTRTPVASEWMELWLFGGRLAVALLVIFFGWLLTLGSLAELTARRMMGGIE